MSPWDSLQDDKDLVLEQMDKSLNLETHSLIVYVCNHMMFCCIVLAILVKWFNMPQFINSTF